jgi:type IV pilus assembly protein PilP
MIKRIKRNNQFNLLILLIAGLFITWGCSKDEQPDATPPPQHATAVKRLPPVQKQQSSANVSTQTMPSLDFANRKDPFKAFVVAKSQPERQARSARSGELLPIQSYEVEKFKISGIIVGLKENRALVLDPLGKGYVVKQGMLIGDNDGRITKITATTIEVFEKYRDENGRIKSRTVKLTLPQKK